ncbi:hypothetical protein N0824_00775 [Microcystis sp. 0824]|nr:hypothetical protein N0824_00775 [Microcystis sp. 0824]
MGKKACKLYFKSVESVMNNQSFVTGFRDFIGGCISLD